MGYFDGYLGLYVTNGDTSDESDINQLSLSVKNAFDLVEVDVVALQSNQSQSKLWSYSDQGVLVTENTGGGTVQDYSARAYMLESKEWAQSEDGIIDLADGTTSASKSAKEHATDADTSATNASTSETNAAASETAAAASAASAAGQNTFSESEGIDVTQTGVGPYDFELASFQNDNILINTIFQVNQEQYAGGTITTGEYGHDMWKSISSANYSVAADGALSINSGIVGQRNDQILAYHGEQVTLSIESGTLTIGATAGAASTAITPSTPYTFTLDSDLDTDFITFTAASSAYGIKLELGSKDSKYIPPSLRKSKEESYYYYREFFAAFQMPIASGGKFDGLTGFPTFVLSLGHLFRPPSFGPPTISYTGNFDVVDSAGSGFNPISSIFLNNSYDDVIIFGVVAASVPVSLNTLVGGAVSGGSIIIDHRW